MKTPNAKKQIFVSIFDDKQKKKNLWQKLTDQKGKIKQFIDLNNMLLEPIEIDVNQTNNMSIKKKYGFRLLKSQNFVEFYSSNQLEIQMWIKYLKKYAIQRNFEDNYQVISLIGKGNFAQVYKVSRKDNGMLLAAKFFKKDQPNIEKSSVMKELEIMRKINHQGTLQLFETYENEVHLIVICELLEGGELFSKLNSAPCGFSENYAVQIMYNLFQSLNHLHSQNILHRDIKPENLIFRSKSNDTDLVITDFGLADYYNEEGSYVFKRCGTPGYVAPEVLRDQHYDFKVDMFSSGILMFILISGCTPFQATSYNEIVMKNYNCEINYAIIQPKISKEADDLLKALLNPNPLLRPTAKEALEYKWFRQFVNLVNPFTQQSVIFRVEATYPQFQPIERNENLLLQMNQQINFQNQFCQQNEGFNGNTMEQQFKTTQCQQPEQLQFNQNQQKRKRQMEEEEKDYSVNESDVNPIQMQRYYTQGMSFRK